MRVLFFLVATLVSSATAFATQLAPIKHQISYFMVDGEGRLDIGPPRSSDEIGTVTSGAAYGRFDALSWPLIDCSTSQDFCADFGIFATSVPIKANLTQWNSGDWRFRWKACLVGRPDSCELTLYEFKHKSNGRAGTYGYSKRIGLQFVRANAKGRNEVDSFILISEKGLQLSGVK